jgi:hypothetical protein
VARTLAWVLRAGVVARERLTAALDVRAAALLAFFFFRGLRTDTFRFVRVVRLGVWRFAERIWRFAERDGFGLRDEDFTDNSPGNDGDGEVIPEVDVPKRSVADEPSAAQVFFGSGIGVCPERHDSS